MKPQQWKLPWWLLLAVCLSYQPSVHAQTSLTLPTTGTAGSGSSAVDFELRLDGSIVEKGSSSSTLSNSDLQSSSRFIWCPALSALIVGCGSSTETVSNVGQFSVALGYQDIATGFCSMATGSGAIASSSYAFSSGLLTTASGAGSLAQGEFSTATAPGAVALGLENFSTNEAAFTMGFGSDASGVSSTVFGEESNALATQSFVTGSNLIASSYNSMVIGAFNVNLSSTGASPSMTSWVQTDPLLEVGNGTSGSAKSDALVVYKNGNTAVNGVLSAHAGARFNPGGDLSMGSFTAGTAP